MEFPRLRAVAVGEQPSPWSDPLPTLPEARRWAALGAWCLPDAAGWRRRADLWVRLVAAPATGLLHLAVWVGLLPVHGFTGWPALRTGAPPTLADLVRQAGPCRVAGRLYLTVLICLTAPAYGLVAVLQRPGRVAAAVPALAAIAAPFLTTGR